MISKDSKDIRYTPYKCFKALASFINWDKITDGFLEPCEGDGRITKWIREYGIHAEGNDPNNKEKYGYDFIYNLLIKKKYSLIISNPPYSLAESFIYQGFNVADTIAWLLPLRFLACECRRKIYENHPLDALYVLINRPSFDGNGTDNTEYAWFIWDSARIFNKHGIIHI